MNDPTPEPPGCDYCGLPLPGGAARAVTGTPEFCCFGCRVASAIRGERDQPGAASATLTKLGLGVFFTLNESVFSMVLWTADVYERDPRGGAMASSLEELFRYLSMLFALPVFWLLGVPLAANAWRDLRHGRFSADLLLITGVVAAFVFSIANVLRGAGQIYFEVGCVVLTFVTLGRWLEATGKLKATESLSALEKLLPESARVRRRDAWVETPLAEIAIGDVLRVLPGERIPTDGVARSGPLGVDEQLLTGESRPAIKQTGDLLRGGALNLDGDLWMEVTAPASEGTLSRLIDAVRNARSRKGHYARVADRVSTWFAPAVAAIAIATFFLHTYRSGWEAGLMSSLAVVLIACPCALGIATPMAVWAAFGRAAQAQVLFRHGEAIERLATVRALRFDKTGTLTTGVAQLADVVIDPDFDAAAVRRLAAPLVRSSNHVLSIALRDWCGEDHAATITDVQTVSGRGLRAIDSEHGEPLLLGNLPFMREHDMELDGAIADRVERALQDGETLTLFGWAGRVRAVFVLEEQLRDHVRESLQQCRALGLDVALLTGDHHARGERLARELGVRVEADLLPEGKLAAIAAAQLTFGPVAMIGDGVNDAPALAASDVGIAMGAGADLARDAAAICLMGNDLARLPWTIDLARRTVRVIRQNLFWAFAYNSLGVLLAAAGWLNPMWAAGAMAISSLFVVVNSLRLRGDAALLSNSITESDDAFPSSPVQAHTPLEGVAA
jgi:heavy metal translocating P-type ATPase